MDTKSNPLEAERQELARQYCRELAMNSDAPGTDAILSATPEECPPPGHAREVIAAAKRLRVAGVEITVATLLAEAPSAAVYLSEAMDYPTVGGLAHVAAKLRSVTAVIEARRQMLDYSAKGTDLESAIMELGRIKQRFNVTTATASRYSRIAVSTLLATDPEDTDPLLHGLLDAGDKMLIVGASKSRKTWFTLGMALCLATGRRWLRWPCLHPVKVLIVQFEITARHYHRRVKKAAEILGIGMDEIGGNLEIINARGIAFDGAEIARQAIACGARVVIIDPLYKCASGDENSAGDVKPVLLEFDRMAEATGAAVVYVHHDAKGTVGQRDTRDRGAGSNVIVRDCDSMLTLSPHEGGDDHQVVGVLARNYAPTDDFSITFHRCGFELSDLPPNVALGRRPGNGGGGADQLRQDAKTVLGIVAGRKLAWGALLKAAMDEGLSDRRCRNAVSWAVAEGWLEDQATGFPRRRMIWKGAPESTENDTNSGQLGNAYSPTGQKTGDL